VEPPEEEDKNLTIYLTHKIYTEITTKIKTAIYRYMTQNEVLREITMDPVQPHTNVPTFQRNEVG
jgi:hypothetical protein